jgi:hypothetical protein
VSNCQYGDKKKLTVFQFFRLEKHALRHLGSRLPLAVVRVHHPRLVHGPVVEDILKLGEGVEHRLGLGASTRAPAR